MKTFRFAAVLLFSGTLLGAFGAHALKGRIAPELFAAYQTGAQYQLVNGAALLALSAFLPAASRAAVLVGAGTCIFSGSLYLLACTGIRAFGAVTPLGGVLLAAGWLWAAAAPFRPGARPE